MYLQLLVLNFDNISEPSCSFGRCSIYKVILTWSICLVCNDGMTSRYLSDCACTLFFASMNPNVPFPQTCCRFRSARPSPNSSFHLRRAARLPRDSDEEGIISLRALLK